jgi:transposase-like protein
MTAPRKYTNAEKQAAIARALEIGPAIAGHELGISPGTLISWVYKARNGVPGCALPVATPAPAALLDQPVEPAQALHDPIGVHELDRLVRRGITDVSAEAEVEPDVAHELQHPAYDCLYLATAEAEGVRLLTADHAFCEHVRGTAYESSVHPIWTPVPPDDVP